MNRRDFIAKSTLFTATAAVSPSFAFASEDHGEKSLADSASNCVTKGELCLQHCMESLSSGSKTMAACAASVREMLIYCEALSKASARKSKHLKTIAKIALDACKECETQCRKHEKMDVCKACAEACAACAKECQTV